MGQPAPIPPILLQHRPVQAVGPFQLVPALGGEAVGVARQEVDRVAGRQVGEGEVEAEGDPEDQAVLAQLAEPPGPAYRNSWVMALAAFDASRLSSDHLWMIPKPGDSTQPSKASARKAQFSSG